MRKKISFLLILLITFNLSISLVRADDSKASTDSEYATIYRSLTENPSGDRYYIFGNDKLMLYVDNGKLMRYKDGQIKTFDEYMPFVHTEAPLTDESPHGVCTYGEHIVSPAGNLVIFYGEDMSSYVYDINKDTVSGIPVTRAFPFFNTKGNDFSYVTSVVTWVEDVLMQRIDSEYVGLWVKQKGGTYKRLIDTVKAVDYIDEESDGTHFEIGETPIYYGMGMEPASGYDEEYVYTPSGEFKQVIMIPEGADVHNYKNIDTFSTPMDIYSYKGYLIAPYQKGYARYDTIKNSIVKLAFSKPLGLYKNFIYYTYSSDTTCFIKRMDIITLKVQNVTSQKAGCSLTMNDNSIHFTFAENGNTPSCVLNVDTGKISFEKGYKGYFNIYTLNNGYKICFGSDTDINLYDSDNNFIEGHNSLTCIKNIIYEVYDYGIIKEYYSPLKGNKDFVDNTGKQDYDYRTGFVSENILSGYKTFETSEIEMKGILQYNGVLYFSGINSNDNTIHYLYRCNTNGSRMKKVW